MARVLSSRALIRSLETVGPRLLVLLPSLPPATRLLGLRRRSGGPWRVHVVENDLDAEGSSTGSGTGEADALRKRRVDDAIHNMVVRRYAPDWLPFVPGASYWVPRQKRPYGVAELIAGLVDSRLADPEIKNSLSEEEEMSFATERGWPSSAYFLEDLSPQQMSQLKVPKAQSDDEDS
ncbi:hypothetical protein MUK42_02206 [Musa troglodytarum]|uniref:Uncharacterized protein n=1 Tax=Musa troglodytarum TaxID=320322 RepID=A0A9E7JGY0_9LILI|nr:hypothetical protein MUK42_02206 [Musa troglodytarum]